MQPKRISLIQLNIAVLMWGGTAMFAKGIALPVTHIICLRSLVGAAALWLLLRVLRSPATVKRAGHWGGIIAAGLLLCAHWLTYFQALRVSGAAVAILALHTYPVFTALVEPFVFREKLRKSDVALAVAVFAGILIMTPGMSLSNTVTRGIALGVLSGLFFMARNLITRKYVREYSSSAFMFWQMLITGVVLLPWIFATGVSCPPRTAGLLLLLGVVFTAAPQTLFAASFKSLSAKTVGVIATLLPFYGALFGYLIHHETVVLRTALGGLVILACVLFETVRSAAAPPGPG
ncbi:MAG TPA: DMT family transporter [Planctomycetota bacterium]|nr:DMT family transporter [Planctomycetota bacterium]